MGGKPIRWEADWGEADERRGRGEVGGEAYSDDLVHCGLQEPNSFFFAGIHDLVDFRKKTGQCHLSMYDKVKIISRTGGVVVAHMHADRDVGTCPAAPMLLH